MTLVRVGCLAAALLLAPIPARAQAETPPESSCRAGTFVREGASLRAGVVRVESGDARPYLLADEGGCPADRGRSCQIGSALASGESVIVSYGFRQFVCAARTAGGSVQSIGWLPRRSVRTADVDQDPPFADWPGAWIGADARLTIRPAAESGLLEVEAASVADESGRAGAGAWLNGAGRPRSQQLDVADEFGSGCRVSLRLVGQMLFATETGACSTRFEGIYLRREATGP
ncbi:MAG: hypothetical protein IT386_03255 [Deltaproteobacteria bacterium]|nr:hypothetical protein [Deltaproteobacteria bacterium]